MYMYFILIRESNHCSASGRFYFQNRFVYTFTLHTACIMFICIIWSIRVRNDDDFDEWERGNSMSVTVERKPHLCTPAGKSSVSPYNVESSRYFIYYLIIKSSSPVPCIFSFSFSQLFSLVFDIRFERQSCLVPSIPAATINLAIRRRRRDRFADEISHNCILLFHRTRA